MHLQQLQFTTNSLLCECVYTSSLVQKQPRKVFFFIFFIKGWEKCVETVNMSNLNKKNEGLIFQHIYDLLCVCSACNINNQFIHRLLILLTLHFKATCSRRGGLDLYYDRMLL